MDDIDIFANIDDYMNASHEDISEHLVMPPPTSSREQAASDFSDIGTPEAPAAAASKRRQNKRQQTTKLKAQHLQLDADDLDTTGDGDLLDTSDEQKRSRQLTPGRGQKLAVKRFTKIKDSLQATVKQGDALKAHFEARQRQLHHQAKPPSTSSTMAATTSTAVRPPTTAGRPTTAAASSIPTIVFDSDDDADSIGGPIFQQSTSSRKLNQSAASDDPFEEENYTVQVKVKWLSEPLERVPLRRYQPLAELCTQLAERHGGGMPESEIVLMLNERIVRHAETLDSIGYTIGKYFSARHIKPDVLRTISGATATPTGKNKSSSNHHQSTASSTAIELKIQSSLWKRPLTVSMEPTKKMMVLVILCAQQLKCEPGRLRLRFDGEPLDLNATAEELDLEGGEVMDLWMAAEK